MTRHSRAAGLFAGLALFSAQAAAQDEGVDSHITLDNPAVLSKAAAEDLYEDLKTAMAAKYELSQLTEIENYQTWPRFNVAPYISATHGNRYVNSYANAAAVNYATLLPGDRLPAGSVLAKDSITVTDDGRVFPGALFGMEKLTEGASPETADWRYFMVIPDGSLFGDTSGDNPQLMTYCHDCHESVADRDYTFFVPETYLPGK